jgi:hypothetical protein
MQPVTVDWVTSRSLSSPGNALQRIKAEVEADVKTRNAQRPEKVHYEFLVVPGDDSSSFAVVLTRDTGALRVAFHRTPEGIAVFDRGTDALMFEAVPIFDKKKGECRLKIGEQEYEFWQVRHMALEKLFFQIVRTE